MADSPSPPRRSRWRRILVGGAVVVAALFGLLAAAPRAISAGRGRAWLLGQANRALAPGRLEIDSFSIAWFRPTTFSGVTLRDREGDVVLKSPEAVWDRGLWQILFDRPDLGTLRLDGGAIDANRSADGSIDLLEALRPLIREEPDVDLKLVIANGTLRFNDPALAAPIVADALDFTLEIAPTPKPLTWRAKLANGSHETLAVSGSYGFGTAGRAKPKRLELDVEGEEWPWSVAPPGGGEVVSGRFSGKVAADWDGDHWRSTGEAAMAGVVASGPRIPGARFGLDRLSGVWTLAGDREGRWQVERLDVGAERREGRWSTHAEARTTAEGVSLDGRIVAGQGGDDPFGLTFRTTVSRDSGVVTIAELSATSRYAVFQGTGDVAAPTNAREGRALRLQGDLTAARPEKSGDRLPVRLTARLADDRRPALGGEVNVSIDGLNAYGLTLGPAALVARFAEGKLSFDPIETTLNGGKVRVEPILALDDPHGPSLKFGTGSRVKDVRVNDELSRRVLSFAAPVLANATTVHGLVSADIREAVFPLRESLGGGKGLKVDGSIVFKDVTFTSGPFADGVLTLIGQRNRMAMRLDEPISLSIADRRVTQHGLAFPVGQLTRVKVDGWVDFDRNLGLTARIPLTSALVANRPVLSAIVDGAEVSVPVHGTLDHPVFDKDAFRTALGELSSKLGTQALTRGVPRLIFKLLTPRDPSVPPRMTPKGKTDERP